MTEEVKTLDPNSEAYLVAMAAKGRGTDVPVTPVVPGIPEGGSDAFYDKGTGAYDWRAHALSLVGQGTKETVESPQESVTTPKEGEEVPEKIEAKSAAEVQQFLQQAKLDPVKLNEVIANKGDIEPGDYEALEKLGLPKALIKEHVRLAKLQIDHARADAIQYAGGEESITKMLSWASQNLTDGEKTLYNSLLAGPNYRMALDGIRGRMTVSSPRAAEGRLISEVSTTRVTAAQGYRSRAEMTADMRNPLYRSNPQFRDAVMAKMQSATWDLDR